MRDLVHNRHGVKSTKPKLDNQSHSHPTPTPKEPRAQSKKLHVRIEHISKLDTDDTVIFPIRYRSGNQYLIIVYHCISNAILVAPFKYLKDLHQLLAYNEITNRLKNCYKLVHIKILNN